MSGMVGEHQRFALARTFLRNAPILILDEPTSSVDLKTEVGIVDAIERLMKNRTTFVIAHRLSTLGCCKLLLVIDQGKLIELATEVSATIRGYFPEVAWRQSFTEQRPTSSRKIGKSTQLEARLTRYGNAQRREVFSAAQGFPGEACTRG